MIGDPASLQIQRLELDGAARAVALQLPGASNIHHNLDPGKQGVLVEVDVDTSAYEADSDTSMLVSYAAADNVTHARLVGLDADSRVVFDFEYDTTLCGTSWNARPLALEALEFL